MVCYLMEPRDWIFLKDFELSCFRENMNKAIAKNISKNLSSKYRQKRLDHAKQPATDALKFFSKVTEATSDLIGNEVSGKITKISRSSPQNSSETVESETENIGFDTETPKERYTPSESRHQIINDV